jgi:hypothetical protein
MYTQNTDITEITDGRDRLPMYSVDSSLVPAMHRGPVLALVGVMPRIHGLPLAGALCMRATQTAAAEIQQLYSTMCRYNAWQVRSVL